MKNSYEIREKARESLSGNWGKSIVVYLIFFVILRSIGFILNFSSLPNLINRVLTSYGRGYANIATNYFFSNLLVYISYIVNILLFGALTYGMSHFFLNLARNRQAEINNIFEGFNLYGKCILSSILHFFYLFAWSLLVTFSVLICSGILIVALINTISNAYMLEFLVIIISLFSIIIISLLSFFIIVKYAFIYYLMYDCDAPSVFDFFKQSKLMMKGKQGKYIGLYFSFSGWILLSLLTFGIGFIFLNPYLNTSLAIFYDEVFNESLNEGKIIHVNLKQNINNSSYTI